MTSARENEIRENLGKAIRRLVNNPDVMNAEKHEILSWAQDLLAALTAEREDKHPLELKLGWEITV